MKKFPSHAPASTHTSKGKIGGVGGKRICQVHDIKNKDECLFVIYCDLFTFCYFLCSSTSCLCLACSCHLCLHLPAKEMSCYMSCAQEVPSTFVFCIFFPARIPAAFRPGFIEWQHFNMWYQGIHFLSLQGCVSTCVCVPGRWWAEGGPGRSQWKGMQSRKAWDNLPFAGKCIGSRLIFISHKIRLPGKKYFTSRIYCDLRKKRIIYKINLSHFLIHKL